ncbi:FHA domain-containing protein DDL-like [Camellia sinensis]|uniref:FHA domain-containing protein DDL-like n=1 Tax=Camellia sinensis TaxID=4442 RepID=UPI001035F576|nr:FHA domain-containing protein DDL-like [Camellia sinensis]XP_028107453.1 FHA domain-containing protein DDL-like [Camellia sinensis]
MKAAEDALQEKEKKKPSFELSGKLAAETNRVRGVTLLFNEPPDAIKYFISNNHSFMDLSFDYATEFVWISWLKMLLPPL